MDRELSSTEAWTEASVPGTEASVPWTEASVPGTEASVPGTEASVPGTVVSVPGTEASVPGTVVSVPGTEASVPGTEASVPGTEASLPRMEATAPNQAVQEQKKLILELDLIAMRRQQLHSRRMLLLQILEFRNKWTEIQEPAPQTSENPSELEAIQLELEDLVVQEKKKLALASAMSLNRDPTLTQGHHVTHGGVYVLPPFRSGVDCPDLEGPSPLSTAETVEVKILRWDPAIVQCPSCGQVITTKTHRKVGEMSWLLCVMTSVLGCVAGCCLIPFFVQSLLDVSHHCPLCEAHIHTFKRI